MKCRVTPKNSSCTVLSKDTHETTGCKDTRVCLGFGRELVYQNGCLTVAYTPTVEDGWYSKIQVVNGCVVAAEEADLPIYTPAPCAPEPTDCGGGGGGISVTLSPDSCNLLTFSGNDLLAKLYVEAGSNITLTGCGTQNSPLNISAESGGSGVAITVGTALTLKIEGNGLATNPYIISSVPSGVIAGNYLGFDVDQYGRITNFDSAGAGNTITGVADGVGTTAHINAGILSTDIVDTGVASGSYVQGGWLQTINSRGQVTSMTRAIQFPSNTYRFGRYDVHINEYGSVDGIVEVPISSDVVYDTFAKFFGVEGAGDTERPMTIETEASGYMLVEYEGYLGTYSVTNVGLRQNLSDFSLTVDGVVIPLVFMNVATADGDVIGLKGHTQNAVGAGTHVIAITTTNTAAASEMTNNVAVLKVTMADRGA